MALEELLNDIKKMADTKATEERFTKGAAKVFDALVEERKTNAAIIKQHEELIRAAAQAMNERVAALKDGEPPTTEALIALIKPLIPSKEELKGDTPDIEEVVEEVLERLELPEQRAIVLDGPEEIRNKLELLEPEARPYSADMKALLERIEKLEKRPAPIASGWSSAGGGRIMKYYDLSPNLNGSTKTFSLPAFWRVINIQSSSSPTPMRENTDYTVDGTNMQITFGASVDASTVLAAGQSIIILYAEA